MDPIQKHEAISSLTRRLEELRVVSGDRAVLKWLGEHLQIYLGRFLIPFNLEKDVSMKVLLGNALFGILEVATEVTEEELASPTTPESVVVAWFRYRDTLHRLKSERSRRLVEQLQPDLDAFVSALREEGFL